MQLTSNIEKAMRKAAILHDGQRRKGEGKPPYIIHPFAVAVMLSEHTDDENTIIAGLLHDTIEDTGYSPEEMEKDFGISLASLLRDAARQPPLSRWLRIEDGFLRSTDRGRLLADGLALELCRSLS